MTSIDGQAKRRNDNPSSDNQDTHTGPRTGSFQYETGDYVRRYGPQALTVINLIVFFVAWQLIASSGLVNPLFLPTVTDMFAELSEAFVNGTLAAAVWHSLKYFVIGLVLACLVGIPLGLLMGSSKIAYAIFAPYMWALQSLPMVSILPLLLLILGFGVRTELTLIFISALFPIMINSLAGVQTVESSMLNAGRVFGASKSQLYRQVVVPFTLPFILTGINYGMARGLIAVIVAEIFGGNNGLGYLLTRAADTFNSGLLYGILLIIVIIALSVVQGIRYLEVRLAPWRHQNA